MYAFQIIYKESILYFKIKQCWVLEMTKLRLSVLNKGPLKVHVNRQPQMKRILAYLQNITCLKRNPNSLLSSVLPQMITTQLYQVKKKKDQQLFLSCFFFLPRKIIPLFFLPGSFSRPFEMACYQERQDQSEGTGRAYICRITWGEGGCFSPSVLAPHPMSPFALPQPVWAKLKLRFE